MFIILENKHVLLQRLFFKINNRQTLSSRNLLVILTVTENSVKITNRLFSHFDRLFFYHSLVGNPVLLIEDGPVRHGVEEGPERLVAAAVVVEFVILLIQINRVHLGRLEPCRGAGVTWISFWDGAAFRQMEARPANP